MNTTNKKCGGIAALALVAAVAAAPLALQAATTITIDSVVQRWPWNNKVDITYTIGGSGQDVANGIYKRIVFTAVVDGTTYTIDGTTDVGASANPGQHTVTWTAPSDIKRTDCTMSAALYASDNPSGNDYMVIDLNTGDVWYEGLLASQDASNARYNTDLYKGTNTAGECRMVLRRVPRWGDKDSLPNVSSLAGLSGYPTGDDSNYPTTNSRRYWATDRDYYIGVFAVTRDQYFKILGWNLTGDHVPQYNVSWDDLRLSDTAATSSVPAVASSNSGTFLQRLNYITGNKYGFDIPTEAMFEIAERAGHIWDFVCGDDWSYDIFYQYIVCSASNSGNSRQPVGTKLPNDWGLYDTSGNVYEWCLDDITRDNLANAPDPFTPAWCLNDTSSGKRIKRGGPHYNQSMVNYSSPSYRDNTSDANARSTQIGFRIAFVADPD